MAYITNEIKTATGTNITINDSDQKIIANLELQGDTTQDGTPTPDAPIEVKTVTGRQVINVSGTNLLRNSLEIVKANNTSGTWNDNQYTLNGITFTYNDDGSIKANGTASANTQFYINRSAYESTYLKAGTYYITSHEYTGSNSTWKFQITLDGTTNNIFSKGTNKEITRTITSDMYLTTAQLIIYAGQTVSNVIFYPMIAKESGIDYEQYKVQTCEINLGKNLYKPFSYTRTSQGVIYTYNEDGTITASGTATGTSSVSITRADAYANGWYYSLSPGTYKLSGGIDNTKKLQVITADTGTSVATTGTSGVATFTINNYTIVYLRATISNETQTNDTFYPQIEKGSQATSWSVYKKPIKLCKLGTTFIDKINKSTGKNLFKPYNLNLERNGITATYDADTQTFTFNGTCTADNTTFRIAEVGNDIQFIKGQTRTVSYWQGGSISGYCYLRHYDENYAKSCNCDISTLSSSNPTRYATSQSTFISPSSRTGIRFNNGSVADNFKIKIMVYDITNQTQDYEPYMNGWYIARQTFVFDKDNLDDMTVTKRNDGDGTNTITFNINGTGGFTLGSSADWLSNYFPRSQTSTSGIEGYGSDGQRFRAFLQVNRSRLSSLDIAGFKEYFKSTGVELYCTINGTTVYEPITDEELINQLNKVELFEGINNINVSSEDLSSPLSISYYSTNNEYYDAIYSQDERNDLKIWFDDIELQDAAVKCEKITRNARILPNDGSKRFSLDNFISTSIEVILHNVNVEDIVDPIKISIGTLVGSTYKYIPLGIFNIQDTPTNDNGKVTLKLRDNRVKFDFNYNAQPLIESKGGSATKKQILDDICLQAQVKNKIYSFNGDSDLIGIYDSTITGTTYVSYLMEQAGLVPVIDREGQLKAIDLSKCYVWKIPLSIIESYEIGTPYQIDRVVYESGIIKYETSNNKTLDTLYINASNPYVSQQSQIDYIYNKLKDFTIDSATTKKVLGNPAIDPYDLIEIYNDLNGSNDILFKTLANTIYTYNGVHRDTFDTQIGVEQRTENVTLSGDEAFKKYAKTSIDNINGEIILVVGTTSTNTSNINDLTNAVNSQRDTIETLGTRITQTTENITASVSAIQSELDNGVGLVKTTSVTINDEGLNVSTDTSKISATITNNEFRVSAKDSDSPLVFVGYDEVEQISKAEMDNLTVDKYLISGYHRREKFEENGEHRTGEFYIG